MIDKHLLYSNSYNKVSHCSFQNVFTINKRVL